MNNKPIILSELEYKQMTTAIMNDGIVTSFLLSDVSNTWIIRTEYGWYNTDTELEYEFDSYTGIFYSETAAKIEERRKVLHPQNIECPDCCSNNTFEAGSMCGDFQTPIGYQTVDVTLYHCNDCGFSWRC